MVILLKSLEPIFIHRAIVKEKEIKEVNVTFGKMLPDQMTNLIKPEYEYGADSSTLSKAMDEVNF
ncbi:hypothetical protein [Lentibacillus saliphilus]|uniref:hypothetical protein n=1 Tax=Lentibacillus saliphilus TaxID=2737028 RepID=UPI001C2FAD41|nr:hypothetical protein [Lentibacillus saliphilus]